MLLSYIYFVKQKKPFQRISRHCAAARFVQNPSGSHGKGDTLLWNNDHTRRATKGVLKPCLKDVISRKEVVFWYGYDMSI